jgi:hypothetical protein
VVDGDWGLDLIPAKWICRLFEKWAPNFAQWWDTHGASMQVSWKPHIRE